MSGDTEHATRLEELAYQQGRRDADVDARLLSHERRLNTVNGSIKDHAKSVNQLRETMDDRCDSIEEKIDEVIAAQKARDAVETDREKQGDSTIQKQVNRRTFWLGVGMVVVPLLGVIIALVALILNLP